MYEAEHAIHLVRNEQLERKENAIIRCNELENEIKAIKEANDYWKSKYYKISNDNNVLIKKVRDKIEEISKMIDYEHNDKVIVQLAKQKRVLQELLESVEK